MSPGETRHLPLSQWDGARDGWQARLPLRGWPEELVIVDARPLRFAVPTFILRLRTFIEWHRSKGRRVRVLGPADPNVASYLARVGIGEGLPRSTFPDLPDGRPRGRSDVLIPVTRLETWDDVEDLGEQLVPLLLGHAHDVAVFADAMHMATSELCGNAVEHGRNPVGCYVAAQRYERPHRHTHLALGDLGVGVPAHMRRSFDELDDDHAALREAIKQGVTATGDPHRGNGFYWVMEEARQARARYAALILRTGKARLEQHLTPERGLRTTTAVAAYKRGTWVSFELGPMPVKSRAPSV